MISASLLLCLSELNLLPTTNDTLCALCLFASLRCFSSFADKLKCWQADQLLAAVAAATPSLVAAANQCDAAAGYSGAEADTRCDCGSRWRQAAVFTPSFVATFLALNPKMTKSWR